MFRYDGDIPDPGTGWMHHMRSGNFEAAWKISDALLKQNAGKSTSYLPRHLQQVWDGSPLEGKRVLIRCYHGLGDTIQFIRYAPMIKRIAREVFVWVQPELMPLVRTVDGVDAVFPLHDGVPGIYYDVDVEVMELPFIFRTTIETIPGRVPYLHVTPKYLSQGKEKPAVGLVWQTGNYDTRRCIPFSVLAPLNEIKGINLYILQADAVSAGWKKGFGVHPGECEISEYASVIKGLDLLITVDSMPAHLAGALSVPVWTLLHAQADWRWMYDIEYSPWYSTMRLFRQEHMGEWSKVVGTVAAELQRTGMSKAA
jgi:hypothetical protein